MTFGGVRDEMMMQVWKFKIPLKIQIFLCVDTKFR
jgi:hypothetical protein